MVHRDREPGLMKKNAGFRILAVATKGKESVKKTQCSIAKWI